MLAVISDVLCVPSFLFNLVSQSKLNLQNSCIVISDAFTYVIQDPVSKKMIGSANWHEELYVLNCCPLLHYDVFLIFSTIPSIPTCNSSTLVSLNHIKFDSKDVPKLL